jgi:single-stranded-DNA-specific exonuclease
MMINKKWEVKSDKSPKDIKNLLDILLENRSLKLKKEKDEFLNPIHPKNIDLNNLGIKKVDVEKCVKRISLSKKRKEKVIIYGDYDADGICGTGILWEALYYSYDLKNVLPYIPKRFLEGYGINFESVKKLKEDSPELGLVITVDNGIVAAGEIKKITELGIDVIICDHHQKTKDVPKVSGTFYSDKVCGSALAWLLAFAVTKETAGLDLAAIGTIADQMPLVGVNRSFAKYGIEELRITKRPGFLALFNEAGIVAENIGTYEINYLIAPRINATGRLLDATDSLRLICTKDKTRAKELALHLGKTNLERQKIVDDVISHARGNVDKSKKVIILFDASYHEGVIGLAAGKLVEEFYKPAIVISMGEKVSKASARSISGFNIIEAIRGQGDFILEGGGHPMAAGFSLKSSMIEDFITSFEKAAEKVLTDEIMSPRLKIDARIGFSLVNEEMVDKIKIFNPTGLGNPTPSFETDGAEVIESRLVGSDRKHIKLTLREGSNYVDAIGFGLGHMSESLLKGTKVNVVYLAEENVWNGAKSIQIKLKDLKVA